MDGLVRDIFDEEAAQASVVVEEGGQCPYRKDEVMEWVRGALSGTKNNSAAGPDGVGYRLIKAVWDTGMGTKVLEEVAGHAGGPDLEGRTGSYAN